MGLNPAKESVDEMKILVAGKITGEPDYKEKFAAAEKELCDLGHIVLNQAKLPQGMEHAEYMKIYFAMIDVSDGVMFLPGWETSKGAQMEMDYCVGNGRRFLYEVAADGLLILFRDCAKATYQIWKQLIHRKWSEANREAARKVRK